MRGMQRHLGTCIVLNPTKVGKRSTAVTYFIQRSATSFGLDMDTFYEFMHMASPFSDCEKNYPDYPSTEIFVPCQSTASSLLYPHICDLHVSPSYRRAV
jgi:hypothetical protein